MKNYYFLLIIIFIFLTFSCFSQGWVGTGSIIYGVNSSQALTPLNVGIGTLSPSAQFHTTGTIRFQGLTTNNTLTRLLVADASGNLFTRDASTIGTSNAWLLTGNAATNPSLNFLGTTDNNRLVFRTNNVERMTVTSAGNVGIGITTPAVTFHVINGTTGTMGHPYETAIVERNGDLKLGVYSTLTNPTLGGSSIIMGYSNFLMADGTYPNYEIQQGQFTGAANAFYLRFNASPRNAAGNITTSAYQNVMVMDNAGHVGINLLNGLPVPQPTANLHVNGTVRFQGLTTAGGNYLVVDANGNVFRSANTTPNIVVRNPNANSIYSDDIMELKNEVANLKDQVGQLLRIINQKNPVILENSKKGFLIYPNPANDVIRISALNENSFGNKTVTFQNIQGKIMNSFSMDNSLSIPVRNVTSGTYIVNIFENNNLLQSEKVVVSK